MCVCVCVLECVYVYVTDRILNTFTVPPVCDSVRGIEGEKARG
jgi:hypothetical protein